MDGTYFLQETSNWSWSSLAPFLIQSRFTGELWKEGHMKSWKVWRWLIEALPRSYPNTFLQCSIHCIIYFSTPPNFFRWNRTKITKSKRSANFHKISAPLCRDQKVIFKYIYINIGFHDYYVKMSFLFQLSFGWTSFIKKQTCSSTCTFYPFTSIYCSTIACWIPRTPDYQHKHDETSILKISCFTRKSTSPHQCCVTKMPF